MPTVDKKGGARIEMDRITKHFGAFAAVDDASLQVEGGQLAALLGPSGSGKTTLLRVLAGLELQDAGHVYVNGECIDKVPAGERNIGFVFQNYALFRHMTVFDNVAFGLNVQKKDKSLINDRVNELIELVGLKGTEKRYPAQLSGGQCQRVAFARALACDPQILLLDEPFAAIDAKVRTELRLWLKEMIGQVGITSVFVTHDQSEAIEVADKIIVTNSGGIDQAGTPEEIYRNPTTPFVARFIGQTISVTDAGLLCAYGLAGANAPDDVLVRPENVHLLAADAPHRNDAPVFHGSVEQVSFRGDHAEVIVRAGDQTITASADSQQSLFAAGGTVDFMLDSLMVCRGNDVEVLDVAR